jgi:Domain of unknown function (DUF4260)
MPTRPAIALPVEGGGILAMSISLHAHPRQWVALRCSLSFSQSLHAWLSCSRPGWRGIYNFAHTLTIPLLLLAVGLLAARSGFFPFVLIWTAHIGFDRLLGYGLKYPTHFKDTHLQHV